MSDMTLERVRRLIDQLSPLDQARLLEYLTPRIASAAASARQGAPAEAWDEFFRIGDAIAASDTQGSETLTAAVVTMRR